MVYRYRLKDRPENKTPTRMVNGVKLYKDRWLLSEMPIDLGTFKYLVEEEKAHGYDEFEEKDSSPKEDYQDESEIPVYDENDIKDAFLSDTQEPEKDLLDMDREELIEKAKEHGFVLEEYEGLDRDKLLQLFFLEDTVEAHNA